MKIKNNLENKSIIFLLLFSFLLLLIQILNKETSQIIFLIQVPLILLYLLLTLKKQKNNFLILLFFICNIVFLYGKIYIKIIKNEKLLGMFFASYLFNIDTFLEIVKVINYNLFGIILGIFLYQIYIHKNKSNKKIKKINLKIYMYHILLIIGSISIILSYKLSQIVNSYGYLSLYNGIAKKVFGNIQSQALFLFSNIFISLIFIILTTFNDSKKKKYYIGVLTLFLIFKFSESLAGGRSGIIGCLLFILWYSHKFLKIKINLLKLIMIGLLSVSLCFYISSKRDVGNKQNFKVVGVEKIYEFLDEQGGSISLLGYYIDNKEKLNINTKPMIFSFLLGGPEKIICKVTHQKYQPERSFYNGERISSVINPKLYKAGYGTGGNYLVEMYDLGRKFGVIFWTALLIFFLYYIQDNFLYMGLFKRMFSLYYIYNIFLLPRTHYLAIGITGSVFLIFIYLIILLFKIGSKKI